MCVRVLVCMNVYIYTDMSACVYHVQAKLVLMSRSVTRSNFTMVSFAILCGDNT